MFTQAHVVSVDKPEVQGRELHLHWVLDTPGLNTQIYINGKLAWYGTESSCRIPYPPPSEAPLRVVLGTVDAGELETDFSSTLPTPPKRRLTLTWQGGTFEGADLAGFHIYGPANPGGPVIYGVPLKTITAYPADIILDGYGLGGFGEGGFGQAASTYTWTSESLMSGDWTFAVVPFDAAGNEGTISTFTGTIHAPPLPPALFPFSTDRLRYSVLAYGDPGYGEGAFGEPKIVLDWEPSPG